MKKNNVILDQVYTDEVYTAGKLKLTIRYVALSRTPQHILYVERIDGSSLIRKFVFNGFLDGYNEAKKTAMDIAMREGGC